MYAVFVFVVVVVVVKVKKDSYFKELDFSAQSVQSLPRQYQDFTCF